MRDPAKAERDRGEEVFRKVINITSVSGTMGNAGQVNYSSGKAAVTGLTKTLAKEWGQFKVNVNAVAFGFVETRLTAAKEEAGSIEREGETIELGIPEQQRAMASMIIPVGRPAQPGEAAGPVLFLASELANYVHGQILNVTGGQFGGMTTCKVFSSADHELEADLCLERRAQRVQRHVPRLLSDYPVDPDATPLLERLDRISGLGAEVAIDRARAGAPHARAVFEHGLQVMNDRARGPLTQHRHRTAVGQSVPRRGADDPVDGQTGRLLNLLDRLLGLVSKDAIDDETEVGRPAHPTLCPTDHVPAIALTDGRLTRIRHQCSPRSPWRLLHSPCRFCFRVKAATPAARRVGVRVSQAHRYGITIVNPTVLLSSAGPDTVALF
jgi:hypothetical protein